MFVSGSSAALLSREFHHDGGVMRIERFRKPGIALLALVSLHVMTRIADS